MVINTKFKITDIIWYMRQNSPVQGIIHEINIRVNKVGEITVEYIGSWYQTQWGFSEIEHRVFATKEELLKSL